MNYIQSHDQRIIILQMLQGRQQIFKCNLTHNPNHPQLLIAITHRLNLKLLQSLIYFI